MFFPPQSRVDPEKLSRHIMLNLFDFVDGVPEHNDAPPNCLFCKRVSFFAEVCSLASIPLTPAAPVPVAPPPVNPRKVFQDPLTDENIPTFFNLWCSNRLPKALSPGRTCPELSQTVSPWSLLSQVVMSQITCCRF